MIDARCICRPLTLDDAERCAEIGTAISARANVDEQIQARIVRTEWTAPNFDLRDSSIGILNGDGKLLGFAVLFATDEPPVRPWFDWGVDPEHGDNDLYAYLLAWAQDRGKAVIPMCPPEARVGLWSGAHKGYRANEEALKAAGFLPEREWLEMRIDMTERPAPVELPPGFVLRPYRQEEDLPLLVDVVRDAFSDHYGHIEQSYERDLQMFRHWFSDDPALDPDLVMLAVDRASGAVAGSVLPLTEYHRRPGVGYIDMVGVCKAFRRRGLASALLTRSFIDFWDRGTKSVCLEVDGASLTNAVALYEGVGMRARHSYVAYEKLLRAGVELAKVALE